MLTGCIRRDTHDTGVLINHSVLSRSLRLLSARDTRAHLELIVIYGIDFATSG